MPNLMLISDSVCVCANVKSGVGVAYIYTIYIQRHLTQWVLIIINTAVLYCVLLLQCLGRTRQ